MEPFKINNYERIHGVGTFVPFRHLSEAEAERILDVLRRSLGLGGDFDSSKVVDTIYKRSVLVKGVNAESDDFCLKELLETLRFDVSDTVYLNWYRWDNIDELNTEDLSSSFDDIWYPGPDDLDILDSRMRWIVLIEHDGTVRALDIVRK